MLRNIRALTLAITCCFFLTSCAKPRPRRSPAVATRTFSNLLVYANPFCGTTHDGGLYPGATAPFGMIQWSPDSGRRPTLAGYNYRDTSIDGFSVDHLSGGGSWYGGNFAFMPISADGLARAPADRYAFNTPFSHEREAASPGYYSVTLDNGVRVELTATVHDGFGRFTFPSNSPETMVINAGSNINGARNSSVQIDPASRSISGSATGGRFLGHPNYYTLYLYAVFNRPFIRYGTWSGKKLLKGQTKADGRTSGAYVVFDPSRSPTVLARVGISYVSIANARANLENENPVAAFSPNAFERAVHAAGKNWNSWLNRIQITGGAAAGKKTFYSIFYHLLLAPTICSDANGQYRGYDGRVHALPQGHCQYAYFSGWDIYRSDCQFLAMIAPDEASDMAQSLLRDYQQGGTFPRWGLVVQDSGVMDGDPAAPIIAGFHAFGATNFDVHAALAGLVNAATNPAVMAPRTHLFERDGLADYLRLGYVPEDQHGVWRGWGNVSMTLEYDADDFAISQLAATLGDTRDSAMLLRHAQNWRNLLNPQTGYFQMRRRDGTWAPGFTNNVLEYDGNRAYQEGTASQYIWMVPFNLKGLADALGGPGAASARLDSFFTRLNAGDDSIYAYMGNEPCLETPWIYDFLGQPWKTQDVVRRVLTQLYSFKPDGYPGNDDLGAMSSWYLWGALGMYPELPGSDVLVLGSPLFPKTVLYLKHGNVTIEGIGAADISPYVQSLTVNGQSWDKPWIRFSDITHGGRLDYTLASHPNKNWGTAPASAPPSYQ
ncbi:MAG: GH92 family glycosyl hydrolase [Limisphaerales bacterium]